MLFLHNWRIGPATNSSSVHSIVLLKDPPPPTLRDSQEAEAQEFGWSSWVAVSPEAKLAWIGQGLKEQFAMLPAEAAARATEALMAEVLECLAQTGVSVPTPQILPDGYVDHDGRLDIPHPRWGSVFKELQRQFYAFLLDPRVVVVGGNDNDPLGPENAGLPVWLEPHVAEPLRALFEERAEGVFDPQKNAPLRYDVRDGYFSAFRYGVMRFRMATEPGPEIVRSEVPELVDLSVGNWCAQGCRYCYRGSTTEGGWASLQVLQGIQRALASLGTFELALGGGEPMAHPELPRLLQQSNTGGLRLNITTRNLNWFKRPHPEWNALNDKIAAFGFSVDTVKQAQAAIAAFGAANILHKLNLQVVVGAVAPETIQAIVQVARSGHARVTLLGYKTTGFGGNVRRKPAPAPETVLSSTPHVGIDTVLAQEWAPWLRENAWSGSYRMREGAFSCFIDGEKLRLYRSSFDTASEGFDITDKGGTPGWPRITPESIQRAYQAMQAAEGLCG